MPTRRLWWLLIALFAAGCHAPTRHGASARVGTDLQRCVECALRQNATDTHIDAPEVFRAGCREGDPRSCSILGVMYEQGHGVTQDLPRAEGLFRFACLQGNARACVSLGKRIASRDRAGATAMYDLACYGRDAEGCRQLGGSRAQEGDLVGALRAYRAACSGGDGAGCQALADMYRRGRGVSKNLERARKLYLRACARGQNASCSALGSL